MSALDLLIHLLNFAAPAFFVALLLAMLFRLAMHGRSAAVSLWKQVGINFAAGLVVLAAGLVFFGRDGRIATYAALVLVCGSVQWWLLRGWRN
ncbi:hypothetical protein [Variovorax sp. KK3]|uniref:hypothetical protein n=1 Tax=Variovorax sp. KK3 TaxID=1855728 RepID=UPI00097CB62F|nr:hypothetical protein [Variovorax sp. KK3]